MRSIRPAVGLGLALSGSTAERQLYDIALRADDGSWRVVAPHAVYFRSQWSDFGLAHITDTHVARRIDRFREALVSAGMADGAERMINWNDRFRGFVRFANQLHAAGDLDLIVATGDLVDYLARHSPKVQPQDSALRDAHPDWFDPDTPSLGVTFVKRGDSQDLLDYGVSRGRAGDLLAGLAGRGTARKADVVLAGHTHHHNEMTIRETHGGQLALYLDHYTENPTAYYPSTWVSDEDWHDLVVDTTGARDNHSTVSYVELDADALSWARPWELPVRARHRQVVQVPPYGDPLNGSADPAGWWARHRPLLLQTGALGPRENTEITFSGFRLLTVRGNVIQRMHFVPIERLERHGFALTPADAVRVDPPRPVRHVERSRRFGTPAAVGAPCLVRPGDPATHSIVYRDAENYLVELWDVPGSTGGGRLAERALAPAAGGNPSSFQDRTSTASTWCCTEPTPARYTACTGTAPNAPGMTPCPRSPGRRSRRAHRMAGPSAG